MGSKTSAYGKSYGESGGVEGSGEDYNTQTREG